MLDDDIDYIEFRIWKAADKDWNVYAGGNRRQAANKIPGYGEVAVIESKGGSYDGDAEGPTHVIVSLTRVGGAARFFKKTGYYNSYDGTKWDGAFVEAFPRTATVTNYVEDGS